VEDSRDKVEKSKERKRGNVREGDRERGRRKTKGSTWLEETVVWEEKRRRKEEAKGVDKGEEEKEQAGRQARRVHGDEPRQSIYFSPRSAARLPV
jgi:hypothetical protein